MIDRLEIDRAFQLCLRREVHDEAVYGFFGALSSLDAVYSAIFDSPEFRGRLAPAPHDVGAERLEIESEAGPENIARMIAHVEATWTRLGETEPHWSVLTDPRFKPENFQANQSEYRQSGKRDEARMEAAAIRVGLDLTRLRTCFELGCGTGRITEWLALRFSQVTAADISRAHLQAARHALAGEPHVTWLHLARLDDLAELPPFDMLYSCIVLQHNPPPVISAILRRLLARLSPGGAAYFQVPVWMPGYRFRSVDYLAGLHTGPMEMHALPQHHLLSIVRDAGCRVLELREDPLGPRLGGISNTLLVEKDDPAARIAR